VLGAKALRCGPRPRELVEGAFFEADGEGLDRARLVLAHQGENGGGVEATTQEDADRHVAHQVASYRVVEPLAQGLGVVTGLDSIERLRVVGAPVALDAHTAAFDHHEMAGQDLSDLDERRVRRRNVTEGEIVVHGLQVDLAIHAGSDQRLDLGGEQEAVVIDGEDEWLDAEPITPQHQAFGPVIQSAKANMPRRRRTNSRPWSS